MKFNGFHFVVVCHAHHATNTQHAAKGAGYAKHFVLFWHVNYASAAFFASLLLLLLFVIVDATTQQQQTVPFVVVILLFLFFYLI